jgi:hypothetical protein
MTSIFSSLKRKTELSRSSSKSLLTEKNSKKRSTNIKIQSTELETRCHLRSE